MVAGRLACGVAAVELINVILFSRVTLIRTLRSKSDLNHFHSCELPCSRVKSSDNLISDRGGDSGVLFSFIYI